MKIVCPSCGFKHNVRSRGKVYGGTRKEIKSINYNKQVLCRVLTYAKKDLTVREVQGVIYVQRIARLKRGEKNPSGGWNYHQVQADLSLLVGNQIITMTSPGKESFNGQEYVISPIPKYYMTEHQKIQLLKIKEKGWRLE